MFKLISIIVLAIITGVVVILQIPVIYKLAFVLLPIAIVFFILKPFVAIMVLLLVRPELEQFSESGLLKFFSAIPIVFVFYVIIDMEMNAKKFNFCWDKLKYFYFFILISICEILITINFKQSLIHVLKLIAFISIYLMVFNLIETKDDVMKLLYCLPIAIILPIALGVKQYLSGQFYVTESTQLERVSGFFVLANAFARFLFITILAYTPIFYYNKKKNIPLFIITLIAVAFIISLKVRTVLVTLIAAFFILIYFTPKIRKYIFIIIPCVAVALYPILLKAFDRLLHPEANKIYGGESLYWRLDMWQQLLNNAFYKNPIFGFGPGASIDVAVKYTQFYNIPHNDYLRVLIENGIIGFIFYLAFLVSNLIAAFKEIKYNGNKYFNLIAFIVLFSYMSMSFAANIFYNANFFWYFFSFLAITHKINSFKEENKFVEE